MRIFAIARDWSIQLPGRIVSRVVRVATVLALVRLLVLAVEEEEEEGGDFGGAVRRPPVKIPVDTDFEIYASLVDESLVRHSKLGLRLRRRYVTCSLISIASAGAVPVVVATAAPGWVAARLGAFAALVQGSQQVLKDNALSLEHHQVAQRLSAARRRLLIELARGDRLAAQYKFSDTCEEVFAGAETSFTGRLAAEPAHGGEYP